MHISLSIMFARTCICLLALFIGTSDALYIDGCAMYGCRPSGSFSFYLDSTKTNMSLNWVRHLDAVPNAMGCSANSVSVICQSNGVFSTDMGYMSLYGTNGTTRWKDTYLHYPTLALLDNYGDVTGSDGVSLVHYDMDGKKYPIIPVNTMAPIFSMQLVGTRYLLMVSQKGCLSIRDLNAIPDAAIFLQGEVQRANGTFLPISPPVVNGMRFYILTEFVPESETDDPSLLNLQRLYAIDMHDRMVNIMTVAWYYNFERLSENPKDKRKETNPKFHNTQGRSDNDEDVLKYKPTSGGKDAADKYVHEYNIRKTYKQRVKDTYLASKQILLWNNRTQTIHVILPPPYASDSNAYVSFWGLKDTNDSVTLSFQTSLRITHMATFESDSDITQDTGNGDQSDTSIIKNELWATTDGALIHSITENGNISRTIDLSAVCSARVTITSKLSVVRKDDNYTDVLVVGVTVRNTTNTFKNLLVRFELDANSTSFVIGVDTSIPSGKLAWVVSVPNNLEVKGQIVGSAGTALQIKDQLIMYADDNDKAAQIISIN